MGVPNRVTSLDRDAFFERLAALPGAALGEGAFSPRAAIWVGRREVAHFDRDGALDIRLTKPVIRIRRDDLRLNARVVLRTSGSDWLEFDVDDESADEAVMLGRRGHFGERVNNRTWPTAGGSRPGTAASLPLTRRRVRARDARAVSRWRREGGRRW